MDLPLVREDREGHISSVPIIAPTVNVEWSSAEQIIAKSIQVVNPPQDGVLSYFGFPIALIAKLRQQRVLDDRDFENSRENHMTRRTMEMLAMITRSYTIALSPVPLFTFNHNMKFM